MTEQDKKQFAVLMTGLGAAYRCDVSKDTMSVYFQYLSGQSIEAVRYAVSETITTKERFPAVSLMLEYARSYRPPRKPADINMCQVEEFTQEEADKFKNMTADDFFEGILKKTSEGMAA